MNTSGSFPMCPDGRAGTDAPCQAHAGRPKLGGPRRVRITTTIEPSKLALLREHAQRRKKSLGQLADEYVEAHFHPQDESAE
jgi:hypothetical protein